MKYIITESKLEKAVFKLIEKHVGPDLKMNEYYGDTTMWRRDEPDSPIYFRVLRNEFNHTTGQYEDKFGVQSDLVDLLEDWMGLPMWSAFDFIKKWVSQKYDVVLPDKNYIYTY